MLIGFENFIYYNNFRIDKNFNLIPVTRVPKQIKFNKDFINAKDCIKTFINFLETQIKELKKTNEKVKEILGFYKVQCTENYLIVFNKKYYQIDLDLNISEIDSFENTFTSENDLENFKDKILKKLLKNEKEILRLENNLKVILETYKNF